MPTIHCPFCNQSYDVNNTTIGKKVQCAVCNETFVAQKEEAILLLKKPAKQQSCFPQANQPLEQEQAGCGTQKPNTPQQQVVYIQVPSNQKSRGIYVMLGLFLGCFGIHNFYAGHIARGIAHLVLAVWPSVGVLVRLSRIEGDYAQYDVAYAVQGLLITWLVNIIWVIVELITIKKDGRGIPMNC